MNTICEGNGECLNQVDYHKYEKYDNFICNYNCIPMKCPNYLICKNISPKWVYDNNKNTCINCAISFGILIFSIDKKECPICLENKYAVKNINCNHTICVDCFRRVHYGEEREEDPIFPYSEEIEDEYFDDPDNLKWKLNYPLIEEWNEVCNAYYDYYQEKYKNEENLRKCPLCRK